MPRILVIDDDEQARGFVEEILKRAGYDVRTAQDGGKGLKLLRPKRLIL